MLRFITQEIKNTDICRKATLCFTSLSFPYVTASFSGNHIN